MGHFIEVWFIFFTALQIIERALTGRNVCVMTVLISWKLNGLNLEINLCSSLLLNKLFLPVLLCGADSDWTKLVLAPAPTKIPRIKESIKYLHSWCCNALWIKAFAKCVC